MERKKGITWRGVLGFLLAVAVMGLLVWGVVYNLNRCARYGQVCENPLRVEATVTGHDQWEDSEGDTRYESFLTYTAGGQTYENIPYERVSRAAKLTPVGTVLTVELNPQNPGELLEKMASPFLTLFLCAVTLALVVGNLQSRRGRAPGNPERRRPQRDTMARDLRRQIAGRFCRVYWMGLTAVLGALCARFPMLFGEGYVAAALGTGCCWLYCLLTTLRDGNRVRKDQFTVTWDRLLRKDRQEDEESITYRLHYVNQNAPDKVWVREVSQREWEAAREGSIIQSVYLPGDRRPRLTYGDEGIPVSP